MSKNYMKEVAEILGVELGEKFVIENMSCNPCYIDENGLYDCDDDYRGGLLISLLNGETEIKKPILTDKEREYLASVIAPKQIYENVDYIVKRKNNNHNFYIVIKLKNWEFIKLPEFNDKDMYKCMKVDKRYSLQELGLSRDES